MLIFGYIHGFGIFPRYFCNVVGNDWFGLPLRFLELSKKLDCLCLGFGVCSSINMLGGNQLELIFGGTTTHLEEGAAKFGCCCRNM